MAGPPVRGLIGHTGFVGGTLHRAAPFDACFNSTSIDEIRGRHFDLLVCAGVSAVKWQANKDPAADQAAIRRLTDALATVTAAEFILVSTIDVYPDPAAGGDEALRPDGTAHHAYGRHRLALEAWCLARFPTLRIVRLPALFGPGLRKNAIYDLLHGHMLQAINPAAAFQWYPVTRLWDDIATLRAAGLPLVNLFPEPLPMSRIIAAAFPGAAVAAPSHPAPRYDMHTAHGRLFGGTARYCMTAEASLEALAAYAAAARR